MSDASNSDFVARILKRAADRNARNAQKRVERAATKNPFKRLGRVTRSSFADALSKALKIHGANQTGRQKPSIRLTAPDTGGRPFHLGHVTVSRANMALNAGGASKQSGRAGTRSSQMSAPTAHMAYIERLGAAEARDFDVPASATSPDEMQAYLENELKTSANAHGDKVASTRESAFSFGTPAMGDTLEERMAFWSLVEEHAKGQDSIIQHRLILELPHECSPEDRLAIMKAFTRKYEDDRVPYWCVLHAPMAGKNDDRNFHAHIVLANTPAWKIDWEADGIHDGTIKPRGKVWNFTARTRLPDENKHHRIKYSGRQKGLSHYRIGFVQRERQRFAAAVNAQMSLAGVPVRYDHRSYAAMGLEVEAMTSVKRMILEKSRAGERLILDTGQTKRLVEHEVARIARERSTDLAEVEKIKRAIRKGAARVGELDREARRLGHRAGLGRNASMVVRRAYATAALRYALAREGQIKREIQLRFRLEDLKRHVEATRIDGIVLMRKKIEDGLAQARRADEEAAAKQTARLAKMDAAAIAERPSRRTEVVVENLERQLQALPDPQILAMLNKEARIELARVEKEHAKALSKSDTVVQKALRAWNAIGTATPAEVPMPEYTEAAARPPTFNPALQADEPEKPKSHLRHYPESAHAMIDQMFDTPHARAALDMANRITDHIKAAGKLRIKGKDSTQIVREEARAIIEAFSNSAAEGELLLAAGPRDRTPGKGLAETFRERQASYRRPTPTPTPPPPPPPQLALEAGTPDTPTFSISAKLGSAAAHAGPAREPAPATGAADPVAQAEPVKPLQPEKTDQEQAGPEIQPDDSEREKMRRKRKRAKEQRRVLAAKRSRDFGR